MDIVFTNPHGLDHFDIIKYRNSGTYNLYMNCPNIFVFSKYWMLSIFIKQGSSFVDSRERIELNTTRIQTLVDFNGVNNKKYIIHRNVKNYKRLDAAFSVYLTKAIKQTEITSVLTDIKKAWKESGKYSAYF